MKAAKGYNTATIDVAIKAICQFERETGNRSFQNFHIAQAQAFKRRLAASRNTHTGKPLSKSTISQTLKAVQKFFLWLADQPGFRSRIKYSDCEYFTPDRRDARSVTTAISRPVPSLEQIRHVIAAMPSDTQLERRDRAVVDFAILTGVRDRALISLRMKHVDVTARRVIQHGGEVHTKAGKTIETIFFPVGEEIEAIVMEWLEFLRVENLFGSEDPVFPRTMITTGNEGFRSDGVARESWKTADTVRKIFRAAFEAAGLAPVNPHSFRHTLAQYGERICQTPEQFKAWSQNLGHEHVSTTFTSYGRVPPHRQAELIGGLAAAPARENALLGEIDRIADAVANRLSDRSEGARER
ncbi:MAG: site-specific integrase [Pseudomonadota bacterium]